jgi:hypothetical protein
VDGSYYTVNKVHAERTVDIRSLNGFLVALRDRAVSETVFLGLLTHKQGAERPLPITASLLTKKV